MVIQSLNTAFEGRYQILRKLGGGGQGSVFLANNQDYGTVAIKLFSPYSDEERIKREVGLLITLEHPSIVSVIDHGTLKYNNHNIFYIVYNYVEGRNMRQIIKEQRKLDYDQLLLIGKQIGEAIEKLWQSRIVHRDIKPENIIITPEGQSVLVDISFAQHLNLQTITPAHHDPGTNGYRSPERCGRRSRLTVYSDVFSFGVTLYEIASFAHPWNHNQHSICNMHEPREFSPRIRAPSRFKTLVTQMIDLRPYRRPKDPGHRFQQLIELE